MRECTILHMECEKGHSWLTATNWVQHPCPTCQRQALEKAGDILAHQLMYGEHAAELAAWWAARDNKCSYCDPLHPEEGPAHGL
jgi:hypothetical protein